MNDSVPMLGLIAVAVSVVVGLYAFDVTPRQGSIATNRAWWPSYASQPAPTSAPSSSSYGNEPAAAPAETAAASTPQAPSGQAQPQQQAPMPSQPQYGPPNP
jgi:hypothetical protein